jgi:tetratricopeptide (TPR) repeat protein
MPALKCKICGGDFENLSGEVHDLCSVCRGAASLNTGARAVSETAFEILIERGKASLRLHDYDAAQKIFSRAVKEEPTDYRVWWGLILCATASFTKETGQWATLNSWFERVKRLANAKTIAMLEKEYVEYARKIAESDALKDIDIIGNIVKNAKTNARMFRERYIKALNEKAELEKIFEPAAAEPAAEHDGEIKNTAKKNRARYEKRLKLSGILNKTAVFFLISGLLLGFVNDLFLGVGFAVFLIIVVADIVTLSKMTRELGGAPENARKTVTSAVSGPKLMPEKAGEGKAAYEKRVRERIAALGREMTFLNNEIATTEKRILPCEKYLALGKARIASMFFIWRCKSFGVNQEAEDVGTVVKLRKAVWDERR